MGRNQAARSILLISASFAGGLAAGLLLAPKSGSRNRSWLTNRATELSKWMHHQRRSMQSKGKKELQKIHTNVQQGIHRQVPDLYRATEHINLSESEINGEW